MNVDLLDKHDQDKVKRLVETLGFAPEASPYISFWEKGLVLVDGDMSLNDVRLLLKVMEGLSGDGDEPSVESMRSALLSMPDEQRIAVLASFCPHCGRQQPNERGCQCWNDE